MFSPKIKEFSTSENKELLTTIEGLRASTANYALLLARELISLPLAPEKKKAKRMKQAKAATDLRKFLFNYIEKLETKTEHLIKCFFKKQSGGFIHECYRRKQTKSAFNLSRL